jgi:hypothetical protein
VEFYTSLEINQEELLGCRFDRVGEHGGRRAQIRGRVSATSGARADLYVDVERLRELGL